MRRLLALTLTAAATPDEGYLFVTNRGDEAVASARSLRRVAPAANITFVSDAATLRDVGPSLQVFDVVIRAEKAFPDLDVHDSQGFRLQKLRGGLASPYERTIFLDSDTRACKDPGKTLFPLLRNTDVACVWGGRGNHSGASAGVLAFSKNARSNALWRHWEAKYRTVMQRTRREQPSFQVAVRKAKDEGLRVAKLPMIYNCRNVRHCRAVQLKDGTYADKGCTVIHAHDFESDLQDHVELSTKKSDDGACPPHLSGAHRAVGIIHPPGASSSVKRLYDAFKQLKNDNDFSVCGRADEAQTRDLPACFEQSNKYAAVVVGAYKVPDLTQVLSSKAPVVVAFARHPRERMASLHLALVTMEAIQQCLGSVDFSGKGPGHSPSCFMTEGHDVDNADAKWLCGSSQCNTVDEAWAAASSSVLFVAPADKLALVVAELERRLPAHFLGLKKAYPDRRRVLRSATEDRASRAMKHLKHVHHHQTARERHKARTAHWEHAALEDAFVASNPLDLGVYDRAVAALERRAEACAGTRRDNH